jgi:tellurite resistance protein
LEFVFQYKNNILAKINNLMNTYEEKRSLLLEMIAFSTVDGQLHKNEYTFLAIVAGELNISKAEFNDLFHLESPQIVIKSEFERFQQFYRLALLMHIDGVLHQKEEVAIQQIAINMGLNPTVTNRILKIMKMAKSPIIDADVLLQIFKEQHN